MIRVKALEKGRIGISLECKGDLFIAIKAFLKENHFQWNPSSLLWEASIFKFDEIREQLEDRDALDVDSIIYSPIMREGAKELEISTERVVADYSLMNYLPIKGKPPYEDFQRIDISKGLSRNRYAYFLGMGTGKSYIAATLIAHYYLKWKKVKKIVLITTSIGVRNLYHELFKFIKDLPVDRVAIADTNNRECFKPEADILLMNYNTFRLVCNQYKKKLKITATAPRKPFLPLKEWAKDQDMMLLLDESHNAAIPSSQQSHLIALHSYSFKYRYLFTGTPADKPEKLYNQLKILDPVLVHRLSYTEWLDTYAEIGTRFSRFDIRSWKKHKLEELNKRFTAEYGIYRNSEEIIELPAHYVKKIYIDMQREHRSIYQSFIINTIEELRRTGNSSTKDIINRFPYMMLAVENPFLLEKHIDKFDDKLASKILNFKEDYIEKLSFLEDIINEQQNEKGVIWIVHPKTAEIIAKRFEKLNPIVIIGETEQAERNNLIEKFRTDDTTKLLIANINVLNTSVTITWATWQCYVERIFGYAPYEQSTKRIYRIGQNKAVTTYIPIYNDSLDILLDKNLDSKDTLVKGLMSKDFLTQDEWSRIFSMKEDYELDYDF